jgi:hypothetical protein
VKEAVSALKNIVCVKTITMEISIEASLPDNSNKQIFWKKATIRMKGETMSE